RSSGRRRPRPSPHRRPPPSGASGGRRTSGGNVLRARRSQDLAHGAAPPWSAVDGDAEAVVREPRVEGRTRPEPRQPAEHHQADHGRDSTEEDNQLERDDDTRRQRRSDDAPAAELELLAPGDEPPDERGPNRQEDGRRDTGEPPDQREEADPAHGPVALEDLFDLV